MNLIEVNRNQATSETDTYTIERYCQFVHHIALKEALVLDCGCNTGRGGLTIKKERPSWKIWGSELVSDRVDSIKSGVYEKIFIGSSETIDVADNTFDAIVAGEVVEHIPATLLLEVLKEFNRVLKPGGKILLTTPNPDSYLVKLGRNSIYNDPSHVNIMPVTALEDYVTTCGFALEKVIGSGKATRVFGEKFPLLNVFGSYLLVAKKI